LSKLQNNRQEYIWNRCLMKGFNKWNCWKIKWKLNLKDCKDKISRLMKNKIFLKLVFNLLVNIIQMLNPF
jgi:hypothetical protein